VIDAYIYRACGEYFVAFSVAGTTVDEAGPFDDELDAMDVGVRGCTGDLHTLQTPDRFAVLDQAGGKVWR